MNQYDETKLFQRLADAAAKTESRLGDILQDKPLDGETARPERLVAAMRHGVLNGGKRFRPFLVLETARLFDLGEEAVLDVAAALELIHCYSLVHDDLPAMDDDDLRRGKPTVHRAFDEATAILAGDGLLTLAFDCVAQSHAIEPTARLSLVSSLARAAGLGGMVGGQMLDLEHEDKDADSAMISTIHRMKTGALLRFACEAGALAACRDAKDHTAMVRLGELIGLAFQLRDDVLDVTASADQMGKATGKDAEAGKKTLVGLHGLDWANAKLADYVAEAQEVLKPYGSRADVLFSAAHFAAFRDH